MRKYFLFLFFSFSLAAVNADSQDINSAVEFLSKNAKSPDVYIVDKFKTHDIILLAEEHRVKQNLLLVQGLIPKLYQAGIYNIGMEFGASEDQAELDSLLAANEYSEAIARKLMFNYNSGWAFKEYMDIYRKAWEFNRTLSKNARKFRILNLSYKYDWSTFNGVRTPDKMKKVFYKGNTETYRFRIVEKEIIAKKEKILILTGDIHAFTKYNYPVYDFLGKDFCRYENGYFGNLLFAKYPDAVFSIMLHKPLGNKIEQTPYLVSPANGKMEAIMQKLGNRPSGFDLAGTPVGRLADSSYYSMGYPDFTLDKLFDGYIFLKPIKELEGCTLDSLFLTKANWVEAQAQVADPDWRARPKSLDEYWKQIREYADLHGRYSSVDTK